MLLLNNVTICPFVVYFRTYLLNFCLYNSLAFFPVAQTYALRLADILIIMYSYNSSEYVALSRIHTPPLSLRQRHLIFDCSPAAFSQSLVSFVARLTVNHTHYRPDIQDPLDLYSVLPNSTTTGYK